MTESNSIGTPAHMGFVQLDIRRAWNQQSTGSLPVQVEGPLLNLAKVTSLSLATLSARWLRHTESVLVNDKRQVVNTRTGRS